MKLLTERKVRKAFEREAAEKYPPRRFEMGGGWGNSIFWWPESRAGERVGGFKRTFPRVGDYLFAPMESGRVGVYRFTGIEPCHDPHDMFFASVRWEGYEGDIDEPGEWAAVKPVLFL